LHNGTGLKIRKLKKQQTFCQGKIKK